MFNEHSRRIRGGTRMVRTSLSIAAATVLVGRRRRRSERGLLRGAKRVLKQVAALGAVAVVAMLAFAAADRAEVPAPRRNFDERIRTRVAFEVEERGLVADRSASAYTPH
jgi:hypothetical protein